MEVSGFTSVKNVIYVGVNVSRYTVSELIQTRLVTRNSSVSHLERCEAVEANRCGKAVVG